MLKTDADNTFSTMKSTESATSESIGSLPKFPITIFFSTIEGSIQRLRAWTRITALISRWT